MQKREQGFSILEVLIAMAVLTLGISAVMLLVFGNQTLKVDAQTNNEALAIAESMLEDARALSRQDFSLVNSIPTVEDGMYSKNLDVVTSADSFTKTVTSTVTWSTNSRQQTITLATLVSDWRSALGGDTCNQTLSGDWTNPQLLGTADIGQNNGGTDVEILSKKAYVTANASSANKGDFYIIDVSNPGLSNLPILNPGGLNTGPGLAAVQVAGKYAYVANMSQTAQLQVIDISVPSAPFVAASRDVTAIGDAAVGNSIFYANKKVYLGLDGPSSGSELYVLDVSDPLNPSIKASFETNTKINAITVKNNIAYLAVRYGSDGVTPEQLRVLDVSQADSNIITELNPFSPNPSTMSGEGLYISKDGKTLYLGEGGANSANKPEFFSLNVTNPNSISQINSKYIPTSNDVTVNAIAVRSNLAFLWTSDTNLGFQIWDLNNLGSPTPYGSLNTQQTATGGLDCDGNLVYTAQKSNKALQIIGPATDLYALSNSGDITIVQGDSGSNTITRTLISGNPPADTLTVSGSPAGATENFSNNPCAATCSTQLTIATIFPTTPAGAYPITINGAGGATTTFSLIVNPQPFDYTLTNGGNITVNQGSSGSTTITRTLVSGATQAVILSVSGLPGHATSTFTDNPCGPTCSSTLIIGTSGSPPKTPKGTYQITVTGAPAGVGPGTTTFTLTVQ